MQTRIPPQNDRLKPTPIQILRPKLPEDGNHVKCVFEPPRLQPWPTSSVRILPAVTPAVRICASEKLLVSSSPVSPATHTLTSQSRPCAGAACGYAGREKRDKDRSNIEVENRKPKPRMGSYVKLSRRSCQPLLTIPIRSSPSSKPPRTVSTPAMPPSSPNSSHASQSLTS